MFVFLILYYYNKQKYSIVKIFIKRRGIESVPLGYKQIEVIPKKNKHLKTKIFPSFNRVFTRLGIYLAVLKHTVKNRKFFFIK